MSNSSESDGPNSANECGKKYHGQKSSWIKSDGKSLLRTDGVYVQFGSRIWSTPTNAGTSDHWYNIIRILDDENMITLGNPNYSSFYDKVGEYGKQPHKYFDLTDPTDPVLTAQEIARIPKEEFLNNIKKYTSLSSSIDFQQLLTPVAINYECSCYSPEDIYDFGKCLGHAQYSCNDDFFIYYDSDPLIIKDLGSPNRTEDYSDDWYSGRQHSFPSYFIPEDLSEKHIWERRAIDWKNKVPEEPPFDNTKSE